MRPVARVRRTVVVLIFVLGVAVSAQPAPSTPPADTPPTATPPTATPPAATPPAATPPAATPPKTAPSTPTDAAGAPGSAVPTAAPVRTVAVDASGGPSTLEDDLKAAIDAWTKAAPDLVALQIDAKAASSLGYAAPAQLGPDTLSLDLRVPGKNGVEVRVASGAVAKHPMVLLHEVGVLLGLPEGGRGVMAFAVPATGEPDTPTATDVQTLQAQRTYAREDLNHDGTVDFYDLVLFGQAFGKQGVNMPADFNGDGRVDRKDLALLEQAYTFSPPSKTAPGTAPSATGADGAGTPTPGTTTPGTTTPGTGTTGTPSDGTAPSTGGTSGGTSGGKAP